jgi:hypothetical protein
MLNDYASHDSEASGSPFCWDLAARKGLGRLGRFRGAAAFVTSPATVSLLNLGKEARGRLRWL